MTTEQDRHQQRLEGQASPHPKYSLVSTNINKNMNMNHTKQHNCMRDKRDLLRKSWCRGEGEQVVSRAALRSVEWQRSWQVAAD